MICEDKDAGEQNRDFKTRLHDLLAGPAVGVRESVAVLGVADVSAFDIGPARPFVRRALQQVRDDDGALLLVDWKGVVRDRFALPKGQSSILIADRGHDVRRITSGALSPGARDELCELVVALASEPA